VTRVVRSGVYLFGPELAAFERELAEVVGRRHAVGVSSGTDAIRLALVALGIGPGDEVIVPAFTAVPTAAAVCATGAVPVIADDDDVAATLRLLRAHGHSGDYVHTLVATNARLSDIAAAALRVGLPRVGADNARRHEIAARYRAAAPELNWQAAHPRHVYHL